MSTPAITVTVILPPGYKTGAEFAADCDLELIEPNELKAARVNNQDAWSALTMIREAVEALSPPGSVKAAEHLDEPSFMHEADAIVAGIMAISKETSNG